MFKCIGSPYTHNNAMAYPQKYSHCHPRQARTRVSEHALCTLHGKWTAIRKCNLQKTNCYQRSVINIADILPANLFTVHVGDAGQAVQSCCC